MQEINLHAIGIITLMDDKVNVILHPPYRNGLKGIEGHSHVNLLWWCDGCDDNRLARLLLHQRLILKMKWAYLPLARRKDRIP
jgi:tRNA (Thr-GGU) A37 N-methylase